MILEEQVQAIEARNRGVEADKAWETSWTRRIILAALTFIVATLFLWSIAVPNPGLGALVPTGGFLISTLTMPFFKRWWLRSR